MVESFIVFLCSLFLVIKGATLATKYSAKLAEHFSVSRYVIGFVVVAFISILPETIIAINSAIQGVPAFGLGTLFGSNIADLTLIFAILILSSGRGIRIESKVLKNVRLYPFFLLFPIIFGLNGHFSRIEGIALIFIGLLFYYLIFRQGTESSKVFRRGGGKFKSIFFLIFAVFILIVGAHFTVSKATELAHMLQITPILIGMLVVGLGSTMPELFYSLKAIKQREDDLAVGDILGSVLADATIVVGIIGVIRPFYFPIKIVYVTGIFMVVASIVLLRFMLSGRRITKKEGIMLLIFWLIYVVVDFIINK